MADVQPGLMDLIYIHLKTTLDSFHVVLTIWLDTFLYLILVCCPIFSISSWLLRDYYIFWTRAQILSCKTVQYF